MGIDQKFMRDASTAAWTQITVPNAWNANDSSLKSFAGQIGWYRKDFRLPSAKSALAWIVRFESVNYRARVWLNGRALGSNSGAYLPFEFRLPPSMLSRAGVNRLVIRVDDRRFPTDFPPSNLNPKGQPTGGWWNYGGLLREVYLRRVNGIDLNPVVVRPELPCTTCAASVVFAATARNLGAKSQRTTLRASFGSQRLTLGTVTLGPGQSATLTRRLAVPGPHLWAPDSPYLYAANVSAFAGNRRLAHYFTQSGVRSIKVVGGKLLLNGRLLNLRGVGYQEDSPGYGFAIPNSVRDQQLAWIRQLGATIVRAHYPLSPYFEEQADRLGILLWSEIPVYALKNKDLALRSVRQLATHDLEANILTNGNHPAVIVWSIGNELSSQPGPVQSYYIAHSTHVAHQLDPTRPVGLAVAGYPNAGCQPEYAPLDVIGVNTYFGWYPGPNGQIADPSLLSPYLDQVRSCYPAKAIFVTEFGAEANRDGPPEERGTYAFQQNYIDTALAAYATKPWLAGAIYWALQEFKVRPDWDGGNPRPQPPMHQKGVVTYDGKLKPAFFNMQRDYHAIRQIAPAKRR